MFVKTLKSNPAFQSILLPLVQCTYKAGDKLKRWQSDSGEDGELNLLDKY